RDFHWATGIQHMHRLYISGIIKMQQGNPPDKVELFAILVGIFVFVRRRVCAWYKRIDHALHWLLMLMQAVDRPFAWSRGRLRDEVIKHLLRDGADHVRPRRRR